MHSLTVPPSTVINTLTLHDALPIFWPEAEPPRAGFTPADAVFCAARLLDRVGEGGEEVARHLAARDERWMRRVRSEEHTSELQSPCNLVCRLLLEKKNTQK